MYRLCRNAACEVLGKWPLCQRHLACTPSSMYSAQLFTTWLHVETCNPLPSNAMHHAPSALTLSRAAGSLVPAKPLTKNRSSGDVIGLRILANFLIQHFQCLSLCCQRGSCGWMQWGLDDLACQTPGRPSCFCAAKPLSVDRMSCAEICRKSLLDLAQTLGALSFFGKFSPKHHRTLEKLAWLPKTCL